MLRPPSKCKALPSSVPVVLCWLLVGTVKASLAQTPYKAPAAAPSGAPAQSWKSCAEQLSAARWSRKNLAILRQALGSETENQLDLDFSGGSEIGGAPTNNGSVVYTDPARPAPGGWADRIGFLFQHSAQPTEPFMTKIGAQDTVQAIVLSDASHRTTES